MPQKVINNEGNIDEEGFNSFKQKMEKIVRDRLKTEYNSILPEAFYTARLLPPIHNVDGMIQWFKDNSSETTGNRALYNFVADWITKKAEWATYRQQLRDFPATWTPADTADFPDPPS